MHGHAGVGGGDRDLAEPRVVGQQEAASLAGDLDASGDEVGLQRKDVAVALDAGDLTPALELLELAPQALGLPGRQAQGLQELSRVGRCIPAASKQPQNSLLHDVRL